MSIQPCLEKLFEDQVFKIDVTRGVFGDFLFPNEYNPENILAHLEKGLWVSTGTERNFFTLSMDAENLCECILIRDVNPRVKAYNDFNILLLRLSESRQEYVELSTRPDENDGEPQKRIYLLQKKIEASDLSEKMKSYYLAHLHQFATIYYDTSQSWRDIEQQYFTKCRYDLVDELFNRVQKLAREGNIISTVGCINNLTFLKEKKIAVIDTSNISDYIFIDPQLGTTCNPRLIHTTNIPFTGYYSHKFTPLTPPERERFEKAKMKLGNCARKIALELRPRAGAPLDDYAWPVYSKNTLTLLEGALPKKRV